MLRVCAGQIDFIDNWNDFKAIVQRKVYVCERLRLNALRSIYHKHCTFACSKRARNFIGKVNMPGRIDQIEHVLFSIRMGIKHAHGRSLDRNAGFPLNLHGVQHLRFHIAQCNGIC